MKVIDDLLLNSVTEQAKSNPRLRMNYSFHQGLEEKCHRFLNAIEPGSIPPVHHHPTKDESYIVIKGRIKVLTYNDDGSLLEEVVLDSREGRYGVDIPKGVWHTLESLESGSVIFECKEGPFLQHEEEGILVVSK